jgi:hypothetical protein
MRMWGIWAGILLIFLLRVGMRTGVVGVRIMEVEIIMVDIMVVDIMEASSESGEMAAAVVVEEEMAVDAEEVVETVAVEEEEGVAEY